MCGDCRPSARSSGALDDGAGCTAELVVGGAPAVKPNVAKCWLSAPAVCMSAAGAQRGCASWTEAAFQGAVGTGAPYPYP